MADHTRRQEDPIAPTQPNGQPSRQPMASDSAGSLHAMEIRPLSTTLGAAVTGLDLTTSLDAETIATLRKALAEHLVLCIRSQPLAPPNQLRVAGYFGTPKLQTLIQNRHPDYPELWVLRSKGETRNIDVYGDGQEFVTGVHWHTDDSYLLAPTPNTILHAIRLPPSGGDTRFCNMYRVYENLPEPLKDRLQGLRAVHRYHSRRSGCKVPALAASEKAAEQGACHPLVLRHPQTGRKALYLNPNRIDGIEGMSDAESFDLLDQLQAIAFQERFHYRHRWRLGDFLIWDNRCTMHAATDDYDQPRVMHRVLLTGTPFAESAPVSN